MGGAVLRSEGLLWGGLGPCWGVHGAELGGLRIWGGCAGEPKDLGGCWRFGGAKLGVLRHGGAELGGLVSGGRLRGADLGVIGHGEAAWEGGCIGGPHIWGVGCVGGPENPWGAGGPIWGS